MDRDRDRDRDRSRHSRRRRRHLPRRADPRGRRLAQVERRPEQGGRIARRRHARGLAGRNLGDGRQAELRRSATTRELRSQSKVMAVA